MRKNEQELCEALIRLLEGALKAERADVTHPETDGSGPPVEVRLRLADRRFAIEHTLIEPFARAIQTGMEFEELTREIGNTLYGNMPRPGTYRLILPVHPTRGRHRRTHSALREAIIRWVRAAAAEMYVECPERQNRDHRPHGYQGVRTTEIDGIPIRLLRDVHWSEGGHHDGALFLLRQVEDDVEDQRRARIKTALDKKLPKLVACKRQGDVTVLILEYSDIALTNHVLIGQALESLLAEREDCPDHIFIADTTGDERWYFLQPVADGEYSIDMECIDVDSPKIAVNEHCERSAAPR